MVPLQSNEPARIRRRDCPDEGRFWYWYGRSGTRYIHGVHELERAPLLPGAVYVAARRVDETTCQAVDCGIITPARIADAARFFASLRAAGAEELHLHFLATCPSDAERIRQDVEALNAPLMRTGRERGGGSGTFPFRMRGTGGENEIFPDTLF